ncbi:BRIX domain protein [Spraguea lophii 42_110]|uniref:U3 small nucleolar ribonucleoprotein protein IMP4 n=1 Tax=Spraguea lophii (strain 42_110) TaxID=1358809 RepID=S7XS59_SPRLO|nr:BRIX domain protein [Spraguea lophii 42_110]
MLQNIREQKYYLKRKESEEKELNKKKERIKECYQSNKKIDHNLRSEAANLMEEIIYDTGITNDNILPRENIMVSTSRDPSSKLREFVKHVSLVFSGEYISRGSYSMKELIDICKGRGSNCLILLNENRGVVNNMIITMLNYGPTYYYNLVNVKYVRRKENVKQKCKLIVDGFKSEIGIRVKNMLQSMFNCDADKENRIVVFCNKNDIIKYREYIVDGCNKMEKVESRFDMVLYKIVKGTVDDEGEEIYKIRRFINTAAKNYVL